ncbi:MAG: Type secretion system domain protein [Actinomycetia bacterium]|jgi:tight adherence protein C|nr:Type secretion system domain protein [Actinomycetes bacterium]
MEPIVAECLAAAAGACVVTGIGHALPRSRKASRKGSPVVARSAWGGVAVIAAVLAPGPKVVTVPLAALLALAIRRFAEARAGARRRRAMDAEIPQLLDLLAAGSAAGLSAFAGFQRSVQSLRGPLGMELNASLDAVAVGARWRTELSEVTERLALPDLRRAMAVLTRTETLGTSLTGATRDLAADVRSSRRAAVAERARAAPVKMLFPLVFLVLPAFLLLTVVPVLLTTVRSIR